MAVLVAAAAIAAAARVFLGWGSPLPGQVQESGDGQADDDAEEDDEEMSGPIARTPAVLFLPALTLLSASVAIGVLPGVGRLALAGARRFEDTSAYVTAVLGGRLPAIAGHPATAASPSLQDILSGVGFSIVAVLFALIIVLPRRLGSMSDSARAVARVLHDLHSGHVGDYVAWLTVGAVVLAGAFVVAFA